MRSIAIVTVARSDYGILYPVLKAIQNCSSLKLHLIVSGMHLSPAFGYTLKDIEADGFEINDKIEMLLSADSPQGISKSIGLGVIGFAQSYSRFRPDIVLLLGDRFETLSAAVATLPYKIPIAHLHGGETTQGAIDEAIRHSITKMSHLHFVSTREYADRVKQMGEEDWRIVVSGAPGLDNIKNTKLLDLYGLQKTLNISINAPPVLVTYHPVTLEYENTYYHISELLNALDNLSVPIIFTYPNADTAGQIIIDKINQFVQKNKQAFVIKHLGTQNYFSLMNIARAMIGNSSSGIIEAASFSLPVVNIGNRQRGRIHGKNVINVDYDRLSISKGIQKAISNTFVQEICGIKNPYGDGSSSDRIVETLVKTRLDQKLIVKTFNDKFK